MTSFAAVVARLRAPDGCPWDRKQTHRSLEGYAVEETYELVDAIRSGGDDALCEELGDVLLQVVLHAQIAEERGAFTLDDVIQGIEAKMVRRHPHVFANESVVDEREVERVWEASKLKEGKGVLEGVPRSMPPLARAQKISKRAAKVGFDWEDYKGARAKVSEELAEFDEAVATGVGIEDELGDVLFSLVNSARKLGVSASESLRGTSVRFEQRFARVEAAVRASGRPFSAWSLTELDELWEAAKRARRESGEE